MNRQICILNSELKGNAADFIARTDAAYKNTVSAVADSLYRHRNEQPVVLLSGPSGSGKTTTAMMLERMLDARGFETHTLCMDNYFLPLSEEEKRLVGEGELDLESPDRVDRALLNEQLEKMIRCEAVDLPKFDFVGSRRLDGGRFLRKPGEIIILEGIHVLNPDVITLPDEETAKIYISVRTRLSRKDGTLLHPSRIRLLRRIIRDEVGRGRSAADTVRHYESVERGAERYIMPFKARSNFDIDTFIAYELSVYKTMIMDKLRALGEPVADLVSFLEEIEPLCADLISSDALIREFIGGGSFCC